MTEFESTIQNIKRPTPIVIQIKKSEEDLIFDIINKLKNIYLIQKVMVLYESRVYRFKSYIDLS